MSRAPPSRPPRTYRPQVDVARRFSLPTRTAVLLHPRRATVSDPFASKVGGRFAWPRAEHWPICTTHQVPYVTIVQLRAADVAELNFPPHTDLFQLLWCPEEHERHYHGPAITTRWRHSQHIQPLLRAPPERSRSYSYESHVPSECAVFPERVLETPPYPLSVQVDRIDEWLQQSARADFDAIGLPQEYREDAYISQFASAPGSKVGGFASYVLEDDSEVPRCRCGAEMEHLLTMSSCDLGDFCSGYRWAPSDVERDEHGMRVHSSVKGSGLLLGDGCSMYVFMCRRCESLPTTSVFNV